MAGLSNPRPASGSRRAVASWYVFPALAAMSSSEMLPKSPVSSSSFFSSFPVSYSAFSSSSTCAWSYKEDKAPLESMASMRSVVMA